MGKAEKKIDQLTKALGTLDEKIRDVISDAKKLGTWSREFRNNLSVLPILINEDSLQDSIDVPKLIEENKSLRNRIQVLEDDLKQTGNNNTSGASNQYKLPKVVLDRLVQYMSVILKDSWKSHRKPDPDSPFNKTFMVPITKVHSLRSLDGFTEILYEMAKTGEIDFLKVKTHRYKEYYVFDQVAMSLRLERSCQQST